MRFVITVPEFANAGPVNGMAALANALSEEYQVDFCSLRGGSSAHIQLNKKVNVHDLKNQSLSRFVETLEEKPVLISCCFSADFKSIMAKGCALKVISVRGNLFRSYSYDYGIKGLAMAAVHLGLCRFSDMTLAMNKPMARQIRRISGKRSTLLPNFLDETAIENYRSYIRNINMDKIVYVGSLTKRKALGALLESLVDLEDLFLDIIGDGNERADLEEQTHMLGINDRVKFLGDISAPASIINDAAALVQPSHSEGYSLAALEALYLGVPVVLRDVDANSEVVEQGENGYLFTDDSDLSEAILKTVCLRPLAEVETGKRKNLLPEKFRQNANVNHFLKLVEDELSMRAH